MKVVIIGAGTYGEVYLAYLRETGYSIIGFLDDDPKFEGKSVRGIPVVGHFDDLSVLRERFEVDAVFCPLGNNILRVRMLERARELGYLTPNYIHPSVLIAPHVSIGEHGVYILQGTQIMPYVEIENDVMISSGSNIIHHSHLCQGVFVSNGVNLGAGVFVHKYAYLGMGSTIMTGVKFLGEDCLIGAGAVVIHEVVDKAIMAGVPARLLRIKD